MKLPLTLAILTLLALLSAIGFAFAADTVGPDITLSTPANNTTHPYNQTNFTYAPVDDGKILNCKLYLNSTIYAYSTSISNNTQNNFSNVFVPNNGTYAWYVECQDNATNTRASGESFYTVSVDKTPPIINLKPWNSSLNYSSGLATFAYNASDRETGLSSCELIIDRELKASTPSPANGTDSTFSMTLPLGTYTWGVNCTDKNGNEGASGAALLQTGEPGVPAVTANSPQNNSVVSDSGLVTFSFTPTSLENITICTLFLNSTANQTLRYPKNGALNSFSDIELFDGYWGWAVNCTAITGRTGSTGLYYVNVSTSKLLTEYLVVKADSPTGNHFDKTGSPTFTYTPASFSKLVSCALITNNSIREVSRSIKSHTINTFSSIDMADGVWRWRVECRNERGSVVSTELRNITVAKAIARGLPIPANVTIPGLETPLDIREINRTFLAQETARRKTTLLITVTTSAVLASFFIFVIMHPKYKKMVFRQLGVGKVMAVEQLKFYIDRNLRSGISEERIRRQLKKYNWAEKDIDDAFKAVYSEMAEELKIRKARERQRA